MWLDEDIDADLEYRAWLDDDASHRCPRGHHRHDWIDPTTGREWRDPAFVPKVETCLGCVAISETLEELDPDDPDRSGMYVALVPNNPDVERLHPAFGAS